MSSLRPIASIAAGILLGAALIVAVFGGQPQGGVPLPALPSSVPVAFAGSEACDTGRSVQVGGAAVVNVKPDRVLLKLGVESNQPTPEMAQAANQAAIASLIDALQRMGVEPRDIATDYFLVYPLYDDYSSLRISGYRVNNVVAVTLRDAQQAGAVLVTALKSGANEVLDVQFYTSELRQYRDQARALAMKAAAEKAQALAGAARAQAGCVLHIEENTWSAYQGSWWGGRDRALWNQNVVQNAAPSGGDPALQDDEPISLGQIAVRAEVSVSFGLK